MGERIGADSREDIVSIVFGSGHFGGCASVFRIEGVVVVKDIDNFSTNFNLNMLAVAFPPIDRRDDVNEFFVGAQER